VLRGRAVKRVDGTGENPIELTTRADWFAALADVFGMTLSDVDEPRRAALWNKVCAADDLWLAHSDPV
jgi:N-hydroxyarylamine O-acetyltransferase